MPRPATLYNRKKWQLIGKSSWCCSTNCGHPLHALTYNWTRGMQLANTPPLQSTTTGLQPVSFHQMVRGNTHPITAYYSVYRPQKDEKLSCYHYAMSPTIYCICSAELNGFLLFIHSWCFSKGHACLFEQPCIDAVQKENMSFATPFWTTSYRCPESTQPSTLRETVKWVPAKGRWCSAAGKVTAGLAEINGSLPPGGWLIVTCGLTACTPGSALRPTLGNEYGNSLPIFTCIDAFPSLVVVWYRGWLVLG